MLPLETLALGNDLFLLGNLPKEELDLQINAINPVALIPPYDMMSEQNTATMAMTIKTWYPDRSVGIVVPNSSGSRLCQLIRTFHVSSFSPIVFNGLPLYQIPRLKKHLSEGQWYHVCDPEFEIPYEGVVGRWTRSDCL